jgi:ketosteroid isomerase-like protein
MSRILIAVLFLAGLDSPRARAQTPPEPRNPGARALLKLEDSWAVALVRRDGATFRRLLADGFVYTENDRTSTRDEVLHEAEAGSDKVEAAHNEDMRVYRFGPTAVVTGWLVVRGRGADGPFDRRYRFTDTWVRRGGGWQIVAAHDSIAPAARR